MCHAVTLFCELWKEGQSWRAIFIHLLDTERETMAREWISLCEINFQNLQLKSITDQKLGTYTKVTDSSHTGLKISLSTTQRIYTCLWSTRPQQRLHRTEEAIAGRRGLEKRAVVADVVPWDKAGTEEGRGAHTDEEAKGGPRLTRIPVSPTCLGKCCCNKERQKPPMGALLGHQTRPNQAGHALWGCVHNPVWPAGICLGIWLLTPRWRCPYSYLHSHGQGKASDPGAGLAAASLPEPAATATSTLKTGWSLPRWWRRGTEWTSKKGHSAQDCTTLFHFRRAAKSSCIN